MNIEVKFDELPWWKGMQSRSGIEGASSFSIGWEKYGYIKQTTVEQIKKKVVDQYLADDYKFITNPPGSSDWSNHLANQDLGFLFKNYNEDLRNKSVLEIGAGSLFIAEKLRAEYGVGNYVVVDPAVTQKSSDPGITVIKEYFDSDTCNGSQFDLVLAFHCLEHVFDPVQFLTDIRSVLGPQGKAILSFPDVKQQFMIGDFNVLLHEHMSYFTSDSAYRLMSNCGFEIIYSECSLDCIRLLVRTGDKKIINLPQVIPVDPILPQAVISFQANLVDINSSLRKALDSGKKVAFHGATNGLNNILYLTGMHNEKRFLLFDSDKTKEGKYIPACPSAVKNSDDPLYREADLVYISAMTYFYEIREFIISRHGLDSEQIQPLFAARSNIDNRNYHY